MAVLIIWMFVIPAFVGNIPAAGMGKEKNDPIFKWVMGQIFLWALFQLVCIPFIIFRPILSDMLIVYVVLTAVLLLCSLGVCTRSRLRLKAVENSDLVLQGSSKNKSRLHYIFWGLFFLLLAFQMIQAVRLAFSDGDDAYYVAEATAAEESNKLYSFLPYTGETTELNARHGLAPFPIWIALLARLSGIPSVTVAHVAVPLMLIPMAYGIFYLIGCKLWDKREEKLPLFLVFTEILVIFGSYSAYTAERFLIVRSRQGKAVLGSIIIPAIFFLLFQILERIQKQKKVEGMLWLLLTAAVTAGCLCSTQGAELSCILLGITGMCGCICYRRWKLLIPVLLSCLPALCYAALYFYFNN